MAIVSDIEFIPVKPKAGCMGFVSFILDGSLYCGSIAVHSRPGGGIRLVWPKINNHGAQFPTVHPIDHKLTEIVEDAVSQRIMSLYPIGSD